jgi:hypothetical protein
MNLFGLELDGGMLVVVACVLLCGMAVVLVLGLHFFGIIFDILGVVFGLFTGGLELGMGLVAGGPIAWCGCIVLIVVLLGCCGLVFTASGILNSCGTPDQVNFCRLIP